MFGLTFNKTEKRKMTTPQDFEGLFQHRTGHSTVGALTACWHFEAPEMRDVPTKPISRGRGVHPGAGVPMATLCAQLAVEEMTKDQTSISTFPQMDTHGGTLTVSNI